MSSLAVSNGIGFVANEAFGIGTSIEKIVKGNERKVRFVRNSDTIVEFDLTITQSHQQAAMPTSFPIEINGQTICDHILVAPPEVQLTGLVSDNPIGDAASLRSEAITTAASLVGPAGVAAVGIGSYLSNRAAGNSQRRSIKIYNKLRDLAAGQSIVVNDLPDFVGPPTPTQANGPMPFDVVFPNFTKYQNMVIKSLECQMDSSTGDALVFTVSLTQVRLVQAQTRVFTAIAQAQPKAAKGSADAKKEEESSSFVKNFSQGIKDLREGNASAIQSHLTGGT